MRTTSAVLVLTVAALMLTAVATSGQIPGKMNYQVMLTNDSDEPLADQAVSLVFRIYNADVGGLMHWNETHNTSTNSIGVVSVTLGETAPLPSLVFNEPLWLEIQVDGEILTPRRELVAAPYALHASDSDELGGSPASYYVFGEDLFVPGVINTSTNPVDWTMLKNVPSGFADGSDAEGGAGDGHSLDASDGSPVDAVYVNSVGTVEFGSSTSDGMATFYAAGGTEATIELYANPASYGGELKLYEENGAVYAAMQPDYNGTGGYLRIKDGNNDGGFCVDGSSHSGNALVRIEGSTSDTYFDTSTSGDDAVLLPTSAVSAVEILDEPGVASASSTGMIELSGPIETLLSRSITVPASGYVLAMATAEVEIHHGASYSSAFFGVSDSNSSFPTAGAKYHRIPAGATQDTWMPGVSVHYVFPVTEGTHTFYFLGDLVSGTWRAWDKNITLAYFPTSYGTVSAADPAVPEDPEWRTGGPGHAMTEADIAAERAESEAFNNARIERELAAMEAKIAELRASMGNGNER